MVAMTDREQKSIDVAPVTLRPGVAVDAEALLTLILEALPKELLRYSAYRNQRSLPYLRSQLQEGGFILAECHGALAGYYQVRCQNGVFFGKFIASIPGHRGEGVGSALFEHFVRSGEASGCGAIEFDVLARLESTAQWYMRHGFSPSASTLLFQLPLAAAAPGAPLAVDAHELRRALAEEQQCGYAILHASWQGAELPVGLIASQDCKLFLNAGDRLGEIASAVAAMLPGRTFLHGACQSVPAQLARVTIAEISIRMHKELR